MTRTALIVGASVAGVRTAQALRSKGYDGRVVLIGAEEETPYDKPPLSKQFLAGDWTADRLTLLSASAAEQAGIELLLGAAATRLDVAEHRVELADGRRLGYDECVVATGAAARPSPWPVPSGGHVLRTQADSVALRAELLRGGPVVIVGGGFIGAEVAATAHGLGCAVTVVDPLPAPAARVLGAEVGELFGAVHERHGVTTRFGVGVETVQGRAGALSVRLTDGDRLPAATVVVGIGAVPNDEWLASSGLLVDDGVVCDEYCRATGTTDVWAAGDVARWWHPDLGHLVRIEHWTNAVDQATAVAQNIVAPETRQPYRPVGYIWSDQYDWRIQIVGRPADAARHRLLGEPSADPPRLVALYADHAGRLVGAAALGWPRALVQCRRLLTAGSGFAEAEQALAALRPPAAAAG